MVSAKEWKDIINPSAGSVNIPNFPKYIILHGRLGQNSLFQKMSVVMVQIAGIYLHHPQFRAAAEGSGCGEEDSSEMAGNILKNESRYCFPPHPSA